MEHFATTIALIGIVIVVASLLSGVVERGGMPVVAVFLALGAVLGPFGLGIVEIGLHSSALASIATLGLVLVLFSDAVTLDRRALRTQRQLLWRLLGPGTLLPAVLVAITARVLLGVPVAGAAILGAALTSTDPVLLRTLLRSGALPDTVRTALRIETGMNDIVLLPIVVLAILALGTSSSGRLRGEDIATSVAGLFLLGPLLGALVGWVGISILEAVRSRFGVRRDYESLYALGLAFSAYAAAEAVHGSGFVAAFAAGVLVSVKDVELCDCFLEYGEATAEMLLLLTFVALGTTLIWSGIAVISWRTLLVAAVSLGARTAVLLPILSRSGLGRRDRQLIALLGPRGLSSLLLALLPVFAGVTAAESLFSVTCLVVLLSVVLHGGGTAIYLRAHAVARGTPMASAAMADPGGVEQQTRVADDVPIRITLEEMRALEARGALVALVDARTERSFAAHRDMAPGAVRVHPEDPVTDAAALRLSQHATLVIYCA